MYKVARLRLLQLWKHLDHQVLLRKCPILHSYEEIYLHSSCLYEGSLVYAGLSTPWSSR
jgi:hypothetical protein